MGIGQGTARLTTAKRVLKAACEHGVCARALLVVLCLGALVELISPNNARAQGAPRGTCPAPDSAQESDSRLRTLDALGESVKKVKIRKVSRNRILVLVAKDAVAPQTGECFFVLASDKNEVVAELNFQKVQKSKKGVVVWVFTAQRKAKSVTSLVKLSAVAAQSVAGSSSSSAGVVVTGLRPAENPLFFPAFIMIQNAQHQAANYRTGNALNAPVSGFGAHVESFSPPLTDKPWMNMFGLRVTYENWKSDKLTFQKSKAGESQEALATGIGLQIDLVVRYPLQNRWLTRVGFFVGQGSQTEVLAAQASAIGPENTQTVERKGLVFGGEVELQPLAQGFFVQGKLAMSTKEDVTATDATPSSETLTSKGTVARLYLAGIAGVRMPLLDSKKFFFEGSVRSTLRSDKFSTDVALLGQENQSDVTTHFQAGLGYKL